MLITHVRAVAISSTTVFSRRQSSNLGYAVHMPQRLAFGFADQICTSRSESGYGRGRSSTAFTTLRSEEHTSELQSQSNLVCRLLLEKKKPGRCARPAAI